MLRSGMHLAGIGLVLTACGGTDGGPVTGEPWTLAQPGSDLSDGISILVLHDMEGLSGEDDPNQFRFGKPAYPRGQELLVGDVNAVIEGLFAGGATEVQVVDGHGSGNPEPDVRTDLLNPRATQVFRDQTFDAYFDLPETAQFDAVAVVGMHAKTGSHGFASHTFTLGIELQVNGQSITETELVALSWGRFGTPVIFASGDDRLAADLETMPWIEYVTVKTATSASTADLRPIDEARADLTAAAKRAVENLANARVMQVSTPLAATLRAVPPANLSVLGGVPGIDYDAEANTATFVTDDLRTAYDGWLSLVSVARGGYTSVLMEQIRAHTDGAVIIDRFRDGLFDRWMDVESGRWSPPVPQRSIGSRRYHGYQ